MKGLNYGDKFDLDEVFAFFDMEPITCPAGGVYAWSPFLTKMRQIPVACSHPNHQLDPEVVKNWGR